MYLEARRVTEGAELVINLKQESEQRASGV